MANKAAGELEITLDGKPYTLRPTYGAVIEFEDLSGLAVFEAMSHAGERKSTPLKVITSAFYACMKPCWKPSMGVMPTQSQVGAAIYKDGIPNHLSSYFTLLGNMMSGERALEEASKKMDGEPGNV
jgi:hypothetical protein